jgi:hypothetical protein
MLARSRASLLAAVGLIAALGVAIPVLGADPSPTPSVTPSGQSTPDQSSTPATPEPSAAPSTQSAPAQSSAPGPNTTPNPGKTQDDQTLTPGRPNEKNNKVDKGPEIDVTVIGTVAQASDGKGRPTFTITAGGTTWELSAGPPWYWGTNNPLAPSVGKTVTVTGSHHAGDTELDVETVDGKAIRTAGKPPWAGGPWVVGPNHPGWKDWMANGKPGKGHGRAGAPGQTKDQTAAPSPS